jgi:hypothetical protein
MKNKIVAALSFVVIFTIAASQNIRAQDVRYNFDRDADFSKYKTYKWVDNPNAEKLNELADRQFKAAVDAELAKKGLTKVDSDAADLYISYQPPSTRKSSTPHSIPVGDTVRAGAAMEAAA